MDKDEIKKACDSGMPVPGVTRICTDPNCCEVTPELVHCDRTTAAAYTCRACGEALFIGNDECLEDLHAKLSELEVAASALVDKLEAIIKDPSYQGTWGFAMAHGLVYTGPNWEEEVRTLCTLLGKKTSSL